MAYLRKARITDASYTIDVSMKRLNDGVEMDVREVYKDGCYRPFGFLRCEAGEFSFRKGLFVRDVVKDYSSWRKTLASMEEREFNAAEFGKKFQDAMIKTIDSLEKGSGDDKFAIE